MRYVLRASLAFAFFGVVTAAAEPPSGRKVDLKASDGTKLVATYYASERPGPGIMLLHQCNKDRSSWNALAEDLATKGFHVLTLDYRGYGDSGGTPYTQLTFPQQRTVGEKWPGDVDIAFGYLKSQPGVRGDVFGAGGASCGVNQSIQLARRHPEVKSLVLLSGNTNKDGRGFLKTASSLPLFLSAADDDGGAVELMAWLDATSGNPQNKFVEYKVGGHGTEMFTAHPDLPGDIVAWYQATLLGLGRGAAVPASKRARPEPGPTVRMLVLMDEPGGTARVAETLTAERKNDPKAAILETGFVNRLGYQALELGDTRSAVAIMQLNVEANPSSANAWDSLGDAYIADGQREKAKEAAEKTLALLPSDKSANDDLRKLIRESAQQKLDQLKAPPAPKS
jgi:dienelactone hydrolase